MIEVCEASELAWEIQVTDWSTAGNLSNRSSGRISSMKPNCACKSGDQTMSTLKITSVLQYTANCLI